MRHADTIAILDFDAVMSAQTAQQVQGASAPAAGSASVAR
jgi:hypothetical protein